MRYRGHAPKPLAAKSKPNEVVGPAIAHPKMKLLKPRLRHLLQYISNDSIGPLPEIIRMDAQDQTFQVGIHDLISRAPLGATQGEMHAPCGVTKHQSAKEVAEATPF